MVKVLVKVNGMVVGVEFVTVEQMKRINNDSGMSCERI